MIKGLLDLGVAQVRSRTNGQEIGYVYTEDNGTGPLQRWLLFCNPHNDFQLGPPPEGMRAIRTLSEWQKKVRSLWRGGSYYVKAQNKHYQHGVTYDGVDWTRIPAASELLSRYRRGAPGPRGGGGQIEQLDPTGGKQILVHNRAANPSPNERGLAFSIGGLDRELSLEYWMLPAHFRPAGMEAYAEITVATAGRRRDTKDLETDLEQFVDAANGSWGAGCTFAITHCANYHGPEAPASP